MDTPQSIQESVVEAFLRAGDAFEQFDLLLAYAAEGEELDEAEKTDDALIDGCQSQVWLHLSWEGPRPGTRLRLRGDSDTLMVRGVIRILQMMFDGQDAKAIASCPVDFVEKTELACIFDAKRQAGVASIVERIKQFAQKQAA